MRVVSFTWIKVVALLTLAIFIPHALLAAPDNTPFVPGFSASNGPDVVVTARGDFPPNEGIDKIHDGNITTKWLDVSTTSFVQFAYVIPQIWNAYELVSGNDSPERDPKDWTLEGSNDGTTWINLDRKSVV